jgi:predicted nucleic acid-binding protein
MAGPPTAPGRSLVDTSAWLDVLQPAPGKEALHDRMRDLIVADRVMTAGPIVVEVLRGTRDEAEYRRLSTMLGSITRLPVDEQDWDEAARLGFRLRRLGLTVGVPDLLIVVIAQRCGATLLHCDSDFDAISRRIPLTVESYA